ncbi:M48 family metallopeptidase [Thermodesulfobacteriota bacterium]
MTVLLLFSFGCATRLSRPDTDDAAANAERLEQLKLSLSLLLERQVRTWKVGNKLRREAADLCEDDVRYTFGFFAVDRKTFSKEYQDVADDIGLGPDVRIWDVLPDFQSPELELKKKDTIVEIDLNPISDFKSFEKAMKYPFKTGVLNIKLIRESGERVSGWLKGVSACDYRAAVAMSDMINAYADGKNVIITTGMLRFTESDDELALVLGHEFAHNVLGHMNQKRVQSAAGLLLDLAVTVFTGVNTGGLFSSLGGNMFSTEFEADSDYMGLYIAARAGYDIKIAPEFWRRMAVEHPASIGKHYLATHPSTPERSAALKESIEEIENKIKEEKPLTPEYKSNKSN